MNAKILIYSLCLFFIVEDIIAQQLPATYETGNSYMQNYSTKDYKGHVQNFSIVQDNRGVIYFANFMGVLEFDGNSWRTITTKSTAKINVVSKDMKGRILVGAVGEFGFLKPDPRVGKLNYVNISDSLKNKESLDLEIKTICIVGEKSYFISSNQIYSWDGKNLKIDFDLKNDEILSSFVINNQLLIMLKKQGLCLWLNTSIKPLYVNKNIGRILDVTAIISINKDSSLIFTGNQGILSLISNKIDTFACEINSFVRKNNCNCAYLLNDGAISIGTERGGIVVIDKHRKARQFINSKANLQDDNVRALYQEKNGTLWAALNNGITKIDISPRLTFFDKTTMLPGEIIGVIRSKNQIYFYGTKGIYALTKEGIMPVKNITSACWSMLEAQNELLAATSKGVFVINQLTARELSTDFSLSLCKSSQNSNLIYVGQNKNISTLEYKNNSWKYSGNFFTINKEIRNIVEDPDGSLWLEIPTSEIYRLYPQTKELKLYGKSNGLPDFILYSVNKLPEGIIFTTSEGAYKLNKSNGKFELYKPNNELESFIPHKLWSDKNSLYFNQWDESNLSVIEKTSLKLSQQGFLAIADFIVWSIYFDDKGIIWFAGPNGVIRYDKTIKQPEYDFQTILRNVNLASDSILFAGTYYDSLYSANNIQNPVFKVQLDPEYNSIRFDFAVAEYSVKGTNLFQYFLENHDKIWSVWSQETSKEYNLNDGKYVFHIRSKNANGLLGKETTFEFEIKTPLSKRWYSILFYIVSVSFLVFFIVRYRIRKLENEKKVLSGIIADSTEEIIAQKDEIEKQSLELSSKNSELEKINTLVQSINSEIHFTNLFQSLIEKLRVVKGMDIGYILIYDDQSAYYKFAATLGANINLLQNIDLTIDDVTSIFLKDPTEIHEDIFLSNEFDLEVHPELQNILIRPKSALIIVINISGKTEGFIILSNRLKENAFDKRDFSLAKNLKEHLISAFIKTKILEDLEQTNDQLKEQNVIISKQKQDITDSIHYAKRIQSAVLPPESILSSTFTDYFIFFNPRDIVSGDFYWMQKIDNLMIVTAADCTGHGVPGAFMSMLGMSFLKEIVISRRITQANVILNELRNQIKQSLRQTGKEMENKDGMDIALCIIDLERLTVQYAGANNSLYVVKFDIDPNNDESKLTEVKADKMPVGIYINEKESFTNHELVVQKQDMIYLFSDGYCDQFGGSQGRKFMSKKFKELLSSANHLPCGEQKELISNTIMNWKGEHEQVDDMLVMGIRI